MSHYSKPILLMFIGSPGSGKSYFARSLADQINAVRINSDSMRRSIFGSIENMEKVRAEQGRMVLIEYVFRALDYVAEQVLCRGNDLVYDAQHNLRSLRQKLVSLAEGHAAVPIVICIDTPLEIALQRGQTRETKLDQRRHDEQRMRQVIERYQQSLETPEASEKVITIDGQLPFEEQFTSFEHQLKAMI